MGSEVLTISRSREWQIMTGKETTYGTAVVPDKTVSEGNVIFGSNVLGQDIMSYDPPIGMGQPIKVIRGPKKPKFPMEFWTIGGYFLNFALGADFTGTADEDVEGAQAGETCYKYRIPSAQPYRPESFTMELANEAGASDNLFTAEGCCISNFTLTIEPDKFWDIKATVLAQDVVKSAAAKQTAAYSVLGAFDGQHTTFKIGGSAVKAFKKLELSVDSTLAHSGDITGGVFSDLISDGLKVSLNAEFDLNNLDYITDVWTDASTGDIVIVADMADTAARMCKISLKDCRIENADFSVVRGNKPVSQKMKLLPIYASSTDMLMINYSTKTSGGITLW